jgi:hypothetical protein
MRISCILPLLVLAAAMNVTIATGSHNRSSINVWEKKMANSTGFRLSLMAKKSQVKVHEPGLIDFLIQNVTKKTLFLEETFPEREYEIEVKNLRGELVKLTKRGETLRNNKGADFRLLAIKVNAGEQHKDTIDVAGLYDLSVPGVYYVKASRKVQKLNSDKWTDVESNTLTITVVP